MINSQLCCVWHNCAFHHSKIENKHTSLKNIQTEKAEEPLILTERDVLHLWAYCPQYVYTVLKGTKSLLQAVARESGVNFIDEEKDDENKELVTVRGHAQKTNISLKYNIFVI